MRILYLIFLFGLVIVDGLVELDDIKLRYDVFLHSNIPGGSVINVKRPILSNVKFNKSYLILVKSDLIYSYIIILALNVGEAKIIFKKLCR